MLLLWDERAQLSHLLSLFLVLGFWLLFGSSFYSLCCACRGFCMLHDYLRIIAYTYD